MKKDIKMSFPAFTRPGMIILTLVIITAAMMMIIALGLSFSSLNANQEGLYQSASNQVFFNLDGCAEEAISKLNHNNAYAGETLSINDTLCTINVSGTDPIRTIDITAVTVDHTRALQINVTIFPTLVINAWQESTT